MLVPDGNLAEDDTQEKLLEKFDETLKSLRRQFRKLLKERKAYKSCKKRSEGNVSACSSKTNDSIKELKDAAEFVSENKNASDDISIIESNLITESVDNQKIVKENPPLHEEAEVLSIQFDTESEQSLLKQFEESKLKLNPKESQLQKSPVFSRNKIREKKKNFSCKIFPTCERKSLSAKEQITESPKSAQENHASNISLFSSPSEKDIFTSPKILKTSQKLGVSNLYNVSSKQSAKGNKLKQTKLVFLADDEKIDISEKTDMKLLEDHSAMDSIFDTSLFNSNINVENMDVDMDDTFSNSKSTTLDASTPKAVNKTNFDKISPTKENKESGENRIKVKKMFTLMNSNSLEQQAATTTTTTTFLSPKKQETKIVHHSDSDTDFSFQDDYLLNKQSTQSGGKKLVGFVKKASVLKESSHKDYNQINKIHHNETMLDDETFFSPGEYQNDVIKTPTKAGTSREYNSPKNKRLPMKSFDKNPENRKRSPEYAYNLQPVRRKNERAKLDGWSCWDCKKYYEGLDLSEKELKECMKKCSRHRAKYDPNYYTPPGFWNPAFPDTLCPTFPEQEK